MNVLGSDYSATPRKKAVCACTDLSHDELRVAIRKEHLISQEQLRQVLQWKSPSGCATCRPAINYYLIYMRNLLLML